MTKNTQEANIKLNSAESKAVANLKKAQKESAAEVRKDPAAAMERLFGKAKAETK